MFEWWFDEAASGLRHFHGNVWSDYHPFNVYIFAAFGKLADAVNGEVTPFFIKLPSNLFDLGTALLIFLSGLSLWTFCNMQRAGPPDAAKLVRLLRRELAY